MRNNEARATTDTVERLSGQRFVPSKIRPAHLERLAIVYIRQSYPQQMEEYQESLARQYALKDHASAFGWHPERILVIDEDLGLSGRSADNRQGFQRLLAEVTMEHARMVLGLEMSRLARSCKDQHHLLDLCAIFDTLFPVDRKRQRTGSSKRSIRLAPMEDWQVLLRDKFPGYITWERHLENRERARQNRTTLSTRGSARGGGALLFQNIWRGPRSV